jgi:hypothetical protein
MFITPLIDMDGNCKFPAKQRHLEQLNSSMDLMFYKKTQVDSLPVFQESFQVQMQPCGFFSWTSETPAATPPPIAK